MNQQPFIELEGHILRLSNVVRVSVERDIDRQRIGREAQIEADVYFGADSEKEANKKRLAHATGNGSWVEEKKIVTRWDDGIEPYQDISFRKYLVTLRTSYYVRMRGSRDIILSKISSYEKLRDVMGIGND